MEIYSTEEVMGSLYPEKIEKKQDPDKCKFGKVLEETMDSSSNIRSGPQGPSVLNNISEIRFDPSRTIEKKSIIERVENFLDIMDEYQKELGDPKFALKDIYPLVNNMAEKNEELASSLNSLQDGDKLKEILNQTLITSSVEIIKFNRGDYVSP